MKVFHINLLKKYTEMPEQLITARMAVIEPEQHDNNNLLEIPNMRGGHETYRYVHICTDLIESQRCQLECLVKDTYVTIYSNIFGPFLDDYEPVVGEYANLAG